MSVELTPKKATIKLLERADEGITYDEIMYELHVLQKMERGLKDVEEGRTTPHVEVEKVFKKWLK